MGNLTMFGKTYDTVGTSTSNLLLKTRGDVKILYGSKYIDLIKDGKINVTSDFLIDTVSNVEDISKDGIYLVKSDDNSQVWLCIDGTNIQLLSTEEDYVSFSSELSMTTDQLLQALKNIGLIFNTLEDANSAGLSSGIIYVVGDKKFYTVTDGVLTAYVSEDSSTTQLPTGSTVLLSSTTTIPSGWQKSTLTAPDGYNYITKV